MSINTILNTTYSTQASSITNSEKTSTCTASASSTVSKKDSLAISSEAYEMQSSAKQMSATSGKDTLGISKGCGANSYVVHFYDSAMVSRAIARGYITVNGNNIPLSDDVKKQLTNIDREAEADREEAFSNYCAQHDAAVAKQQAEAWSHAFDSNDYLLLLFGKKSEKKNTEENEPIEDGVDWSQFERKFYETTMNVSLADTPEIQSIQENEVIIPKVEKES